MGINDIVAQALELLGGGLSGPFDPRQTGQQQQRGWKPIYEAYGPPPVDRSQYDDGNVIDIEEVEPKRLKELGE